MVEEEGWGGTTLHENGVAAQREDEGQQEHLADKEEENAQGDGEGKSRKRLSEYCE